MHRGLVLGALVGAHVGAKAIPEKFKKGLLHAAKIEQEINDFVAMRVGGVETCA